MNRAFSEDIENIRVHLIHNLRPFIRKSLKCQFKLNISRRLFIYMKEEQLLTGRFKDAGHLVDEFGLPTSREIQPGKSTVAARLQARIYNGKHACGYSGKPWITIRFIRQNSF